MLVFDPLDPFPLIAPEAASYSEAQAHSALVDDWLGFQLSEIEASLASGGISYGHSHALNEQHWIGLPIQTLQTPYTELRYLLSLLELPDRSHIVDLGAGYGRMGFVLARHFPGVSFTGYEVVRERVEEGARVLAGFGCGVGAGAGTGSDSDSGIGAGARVQLVTADLSKADFVPEAADVYFIYDFGSRQAISKTLNDLRVISQSRPLTVVGRGRSSRDAIERSEPWLSQVNKPRHFPHFSIYRS